MSLPAANKLKLSNRKVYILPTRWGVLYSLVVIVLLLLAMNYKISLVYYLAFLLMALEVVAILHTWLNLIGLDIETPSVQAVFAGDIATLKCRVFNAQSQTRHAIGIGINKTEADFHDIDQQSTFSISIQAEARGWQSIPRLTIFSNYPLGLLRAWVYIPHATQLLVYPKPSMHQDIASTIGSGSNDAIASQTAIKKGDDEFNGHRSYQQGDALKRIDWKASSKREYLLSKTYIANAPETIWYDWASLKEMDTEARISMLTQAMIDANHTNKTYGLTLPKTNLKPNNTTAHYHACLKALALL